LAFLGRETEQTRFNFALAKRVPGGMFAANVIRDDQQGGIR
jgi:hypothetical protein